MSRAESLQELATSEHGQWLRENQDYQSLPRADGGRQAWQFLAICFMLEGLVWGFPYSFGQFQVYYASHEPFASESAGIAAIGTTATGVMYFASPVASVALQRWPRARRAVAFVALGILLVALVSASFCNSVASLIATQGVLYAVGGVLLYFPVIALVDEWFIARKGMAYGIMWGGTGTAGVVVPFLLQWLLESYGYRTALRVWAVVVAILTTPCIYFLKGRLPLPASNTPRPVDLSFLAQHPFWIYQAGNVMQSLGFFLPALYLPSYALSINLPAWSGTLALSLYNAAFIIGAIFIGFLVDRFHVSTAILVSTIGAASSIFVLWGFASSQALLYIFALVYGVFGGGFSTTWSGTAGELKRADRTQGPGNSNIDTSFVMALLSAGKGIGAVISGPLSERLLEADAWRGKAGFAYGSGYGLLVVFSGVCLTFGGLGWVGRMVKLV